MAGSRESPPGLWKALLAVPLWIRASLWVCLLMLRHIQAHVLHPIAEWWLSTVVGTWEESSKSVIREAFSNTTRFVNGFFSWIYTTFFDRTYRESTKSTYARQTAWELWWQEPRMSTFNALICRDQGRHSGDGRSIPTGGSSSLRVQTPACMDSVQYSCPACKCHGVQKAYAGSQPALQRWQQRKVSVPAPHCTPGGDRPISGCVGFEGSTEQAVQQPSAGIAHEGGWASRVFRRSAEKQHARQERKNEELAERRSRPRKGAVWSLFSWASTKRPSEETGLSRSASDLFDRHSGIVCSRDPLACLYNTHCSLPAHPVRSGH